MPDARSTGGARRRPTIGVSALGHGPSNVPEQTAHGSWDPAQSRWADTLGCTYTFTNRSGIACVLSGYPRCSSVYCDPSS